MVYFSEIRILPSFRMAIIKTMKGEKSNIKISAINMKPNCIQKHKNQTDQYSFVVTTNYLHNDSKQHSTYHYTDCDRYCIDLKCKENGAKS